MKQLKDSLTAILKKHGVKLKVSDDVKLEELAETADGQQVGSPTEIAEGQELWTLEDGIPIAPIQDDSVTLADGRVVEVVGGLIESVTPATDEIDMEAVVADLASQIATQRGELDTLRQQIADRDAKLSAAEAKANKAKADAAKATAELEALMKRRNVRMNRQEDAPPAPLDITKLNETEAVVHLFNKYRKN